MTGAAVAHLADAFARRERAIRDGRGVTALVALLALPAFAVSRPLSIALAAGALVQASLCLWQRAWLRARVARLALDPAAYDIPAVRDYGARLVRDRARFGRWLIEVLEDAGQPESLYLADRVTRYRAEILTVADALMAPAARVQPVSVATCRRLLTMAADSPLYNENLPAVDLGAALFRIRAGIEPAA
jgi:hypothetical protein